MKLLRILFFVLPLLMLSPDDSFSTPPVSKIKYGSCPASAGDMVYIAGGKFMMGLNPQTAFNECLKYQYDCNLDWFKDEGPPHLVEVGSFCIDTYEVTQQDFKTVTGRNPSKYKGVDLPVETVTWNEASDYCHNVGKRLPTEAEWEYAAKGGKNTLYPWGNEMESGKANYCDKSCLFVLAKPATLEDGYGTTSPVGSFPPNGYGLYDMAGNVQEWVADWHDENYYSNSPTKSPKGPTYGVEKTIRGGSWDREVDTVRIAERSEAYPNLKDFDMGFRCLREMPAK